MANYLPVLLVSVNANAVPDDSSLVTLPRGQVDYLSHDWQEEDVWRSWRNMTRQKNEITNGVRLENASWRTWWKQRNKLKTISPETLNWLKDSDVTWLYGPLHTAVEWTPPPKPKPVPDTVDSTNPASAHDRLDLSESKKVPSRRVAPYKPILKHRSISELLTSDLPPTSPIFSPVESEDESDEKEDTATKQNTVANSTDPTSLVSHSQFSAKVTPKATLKRPTLTHTKSDTHITRWGANRAFRKDSPPRIDPPGLDPSASPDNYFPPIPSSSSSLASSSHCPSAAPGGSIRTSLSQDSSNSSENAGGVTSGGDSRGSHSHHPALHPHPHGNGQVHKKKHISFNTFVEQCIAIEKPKKNASGYFGFGVPSGAVEGWPHGRVNYLDDDGYDEDEEDSDEEDDGVTSNWQTQTPRSRQSGARGVRNDSDSPIEEEDEDDDGVIEMRASIHHRTRTPKPTPSKKQPRSQSTVSTTSSSSSTSTSTTNSYGSESNSNSTLDTSNSSPSGSLSPSRRSPTGTGPSKATSSSSSSSSTTAIGRRASTSSTSTYRPSSTRRGPPPPLIRTASDSAYPHQRHPHTYAHQHPQREHVTIAPIAPTILKTTGAWAEGFGDEGASDDGFSAFGVGGVGWGWDSALSSSSSSTTISGLVAGEKAREKARSSGGRGSGSRSPTVDSGNEFGTFGMGRGSSRAFGIAMGSASSPQGEEDTQESDGTPVELVYVPPSNSHYSMGMGVDGGGMRVDYDGYASHMYGSGYRPGYVDGEDGAEVEQVEDVAQADYPPFGASTSTSTSTSPGSSAPIHIAGANSHRHHNRHIPSVVVNDPSGTVHPSSLPSSYRGARPIPVTQAKSRKQDDEDAYDFFEGPDLGEEYYYARRGGRGYERDRGSAAGEGKEKSYSSPAPIATTFGSLGASGGRERERDRDRDRGSDRRHSRSRDGTGFGRLSPSGGEERQSRSRSRSHSRTPSPAFTVSTTMGGPSVAVGTLPHGVLYSTVTVDGVAGTRRRSTSASSPSLGPELLSPSSQVIQGATTRGRQQEGPSSYGGRESHSSSSQQQPARGRSSTRTSSSSSLSWERERSGSLGSSPIGSLSPGPGLDHRSGNGVGIGAVLGGGTASALGGGRGERDGAGRDRERERGRERRGRDRTSGKVLSASETESLVGKADEAEVAGGVDADSAAESVVSASSNSKTVAPGASPMDASFYSSTTSTSSGSTTTSASNSTIKGGVPAAAAAAPVDIAAGGNVGEEVDAEMMYFRLAEEEQRRRVHPTPSNSPVIEMRRKVSPPPTTTTTKGVGEVDGPAVTKTQSVSSGSGSGSGSGGTTPTGAGTTSPALSEVLTPSTTLPSTPSSTSAVSAPTQSQGHHRTSSSVSSTTSTSLMGGISASQPASATSPSKLRPPPLIPPPTVLVQPSTSFTAVVSPRSPSLGRSSPARTVSVSASSAWSDSPVVEGASVSSNSNTNLNATIVGKAVDMVSSAGAYFGLWGRDSAEGH